MSLSLNPDTGAAPCMDRQGSGLASSRSCTYCRRRKIRCGRSNPCSNCIKAKVKCVFPVSRREKCPDRSTLHVEITERLQALENAVGRIGKETRTQTSNRKVPARTPAARVEAEGLKRANADLLERDNAHMGDVRGKSNELLIAAKGRREYLSELCCALDDRSVRAVYETVDYRFADKQ